MASVMAGELVAPTLAKAGVSCVFGLNGGHIQAILEGCLDYRIRLIDVRHESAAGHAAEGYAKATRGLGVAVVTAGPGFTNVLTSLANAFIDRTPVLYIAGGSPLAAADKNVLQSGFDQVALAKPIAKWAQRVTVPTDIPRLIAHGIRVATSAPTGPVFLEIPWDIMLAHVDADQAGIPEKATLDPTCPPARKSTPHSRFCVRLWPRQSSRVPTFTARKHGASFALLPNQAGFPFSPSTRRWEPSRLTTPCGWAQTFSWRGSNRSRSRM